MHQQSKHNTKYKWTDEELKALLACHNKACVPEVMDAVTLAGNVVRKQAAVMSKAAKIGVTVLTIPARIKQLERETKESYDRNQYWKGSQDGSYEAALAAEGYYDKLQLLNSLKVKQESKRSSKFV